MKRLKVNKLNLTIQIECQRIIIKKIALEMYEAHATLTALKTRLSPPHWFGHLTVFIRAIISALPGSLTSPF